jgi:hypothetical protein
MKDVDAEIDEFLPGMTTSDLVDGPSRDAYDSGFGPRGYLEDLRTYDEILDAAMQLKGE